jgi:hypothetical protein
MRLADSKLSPLQPMIVRRQQTRMEKDREDYSLSPNVMLV